MRPVTEDRLYAVLEQLNAVLNSLNDRLKVVEEKVEGQIQKRTTRTRKNDT